jgi:RND family efflux transporter MFP subunit
LALEWKRKNDLYYKKNISESEWEQAKFALDAGKARVEKAKADFLLYQKGYRQELISAAIANWEKSQAEWKEALIYQEKTKVLSPFSGIIVEKNAEKGEWILAGGILYTLMDLSQIKVTLYVTEKYISLVKIGMEANISIDALPGQKFTGKVIEIIPHANEARNFPVRLLVKNHHGQIKSGMFSRIEAVLRESEKTLMVHCDALLRKGQDNFIIKISSHQVAEYISISIGDRDGDWIEISDAKEKNIQPGDRVVVTNNPSVYPGANVIIAREY